MKKSYLIAITILLIIALIIFFAMKHKTTKNVPIYSGVVLYYSSQCPHCKIVADYIRNHNIHQKVSFEEKEVLSSQRNANELVRHALFCAIPSNNIQIPLLWTGSTCVVGDAAIIHYFKQNTHAKTTKPKN